MKHTPLDTLLLAGIGSLTVHELAYLPTTVGASMSEGVAHANSSAFWGIGGALAALALARLVAGNLRGRSGARSVDPRLLAAQMAGFFVVQEAIERMVAGRSASSLAGESVLWAALALTPLVAFALARLAESAAELIAATVDRRGQLTPAVALLPLRPTAAVPVTQWVGHEVRPRGPPSSLVCNH